MSEPRARIDCAGVAASIEDYLEDGLAPEERAAIRHHLAACPSCFEQIVLRDPIQLFAPLADESPGEGRPDFYVGFWESIRDAIDRGASRGAAWLRAAAVVMAVAGAAAVLTLVPERPGVDAPVELPEIAAEAAPLPPTVERVVSPDSGDVQIYSMTYYEEASVGEGAEATELILIVDSGLDL